VLTDTQLDAFLQYLTLLQRWNRRARLTALTKAESVIQLHFLDSLAILRAPFPQHARVVDVGSGAGFPGIPLAIARTDLRISLLEPTARKAAFLELACVELGIPTVVRHSRAEVAGHDPKWREQFDVATGRAVAKSALLAELLLPFVRVGGNAILPKGPSAEAEVRELRQSAPVLGGKLLDLIRVTLPRGERRILVVISKIAATPERFPRQTVLHTRRPLTPKETPS
jgi:16S rRNA (guanine527-N7)-methyltransferase